MLIVHTSGAEKGQIYVPFTNWTLYLAVVALVIGFQNASNLAAAYGIAVTGTLMIDTVLVACVMLLLWHPDVPKALKLCGRFGETFDRMETTFYVSRETLIPKLSSQGLASWRARLFRFMSNNATSAIDFFRIPNDRVVELGMQLLI